MFQLGQLGALISCQNHFGRYHTALNFTGYYQDVEFKASFAGFHPTSLQSGGEAPAR